MAIELSNGLPSTWIPMLTWVQHEFFGHLPFVHQVYIDRSYRPYNDTHLEIIADVNPKEDSRLLLIAAAVSQMEFVGKYWSYTHTVRTPVAYTETHFGPLPQSPGVTTADELTLPTRYS